jgi:tetratricopeptide (TPR) repeat protein
MVRSPFYVEKKPLTRADELLDQINELEARIGRLGYGLGKEALTIPALFDVVSATLSSFQAKGQSMRAEEARLEAVSAQLSRKATVFLREIGGAGALQDARRAHQPDSAHWWWFLDELTAERRRARLRRLLRLTAGVVAVLLLLSALYQRFLALDPATRERLRHQQTAETLALEGDLAGALSEVEKALAFAPGDPNLLVLKGSLQQELEQGTTAEETFTAAEAAMGDREAFLLARGRTYLLLDEAPAAVVDAKAVIEINPQSASGYLLLGSSQESLGDYTEAIFAYQQAAGLAEDQGDYQLAGTARVNVGILMQRLQVQPGGDD